MFFSFRSVFFYWQTHLEVKFTKMKSNLFGVVGIYCLWMLISNIKAESVSAGSQNDFCMFPSDLDGVCDAINQLHEKVDKLQSTKMESETFNEKLTHFVSKVSEQLDNETELKTEIAQLKLQLAEYIKEKNDIENTNKFLEAEKTKIEKNLSDIKADLGDQVENLVKKNKLLEAQKTEIEKTLLHDKANLTNQIESLKTTNNLLEAESIKLKESLSESKDLEQLPLVSSCNRFKPTSGIFTFKLPEIGTFPVRCESNITGPGWTVIQKRFNGSVDFYQNWSNYSKGFGSLHGEFFLGLQKIHLLTNYEPHELYIHIEHFDGRTDFERCNQFKVGSEEERFVLTVEGCTKQIENDGIYYNRGSKFSTYDRDNHKCAVEYHGGWWYDYCARINPNGRYYPRGGEHKDGIYWLDTMPNYEVLKSVQMLIRPTSSKTDN